MCSSSAPAWPYDAAGNHIGETRNGVATAYSYDNNGNRLAATEDATFS